MYWILAMKEMDKYVTMYEVYLVDILDIAYVFIEWVCDYKRWPFSEKYLLIFGNL